jgi:hypothetical protein
MDSPLYLGRTRRTASADPRIVLHAKDRGCTFPGCTVPGYHCEVHHVDQWGADGHTDVDTLKCLCRMHHRHGHSIIGQFMRAITAVGRSFSSTSGELHSQVLRNAYALKGPSSPRREHWQGCRRVDHFRLCHVVCFALGRYCRPPGG